MVYAVTLFFATAEKRDEFAIEAGLTMARSTDVSPRLLSALAGQATSIKLENVALQPKFSPRALPKTWN